MTGWLASDDAGWFTRVLTVAVVVLVAWGTLAALGTFRSTDGDGRLQALGSAIVLAFIGWPLWWAGERLAATGHPILAGIVWVALALYGFELAVRLLIFVLRLALPGRA